MRKRSTRGLNQDTAAILDESRRLRELVKLKTVLESEVDGIVTNLSKEPDYWPSDNSTATALTVSNIRRRCRSTV